MSASKQTILSVEHLKKYFQTASGQLHAVDDVNFTLAKFACMSRPTARLFLMARTSPHAASKR